MIKNLQISGLHYKLTSEDEQYVLKKIAPLDRYVSKKVRAVTKTEVKLKRDKSKDQSEFTCEIIVRLPRETITVHERAMSVFAAIDLAEDKLKRQLRKYKEKHAGRRIHRRLVNRFLHRGL